MKKILLIAMTLCCGVMYGQVFITEIADPNNDASARFVELYNAGASPVDLATWKINRYTNDNADPQTAETLTGTIPAGGFYIIAASASGFSTAYGFSADEVIGTGGAADSNGDDQIFILDDLDAVVDIFGVPGEDGSGTCHEFEDGRAERAASITSGNSGTFDESEWNVWADSPIAGCTNHTNEAQDSPADFDPGEWIGAPSSDTKVSFSASSGSVTETAGSFVLTFEIENPSASSATTFDVELSSGSAADINSYTTETVTFLANTSADQMITLTITDDSDVEFNEILTFSITNVSGGETASAGNPSSFSLTIEDDDSPELIINEIQSDPDGTSGDANNDGVADGSEDEFVEIVNTGSSNVDISNWILADGFGDRHVFNNPTILKGGQAIVVFGGGSPSGSFGGALVQVSSTGSLGLNNGGDDIIVKTDGGAEAINITYGSDAGDNQSITLDADLVGTFTKHSVATGSGGALFSPGTQIDGTPFVTGSTVTWDGSVDNSWNNPDNWDGGVIPSSSDNVVLADVANDPILSSGDHAAANNLTVNSGAVLSVDSGGSLAIFGTVTNNGTCYFEKALGDNGYSIIGSPVSGETIDGLGTDHFYSNTNGIGFSASNLNNSTDVMVPGQGYFAAYDGATQYPVFEGTPNSGDITYTPSAASGFELVANPYSAAISTTKFLSDNVATITGGVYFWDDGGSNVGGDRGGDYIAVTAMGAASAVQPNNTEDGVSGNKGDSRAENGYIPSVQGVFVEVMSTTNITFSQTQQVIVPGSNEDGNYYREGGYQKVKLAISGNGLYNEILVGLGEDATLERDAHLDAKKFVSGNALSFYSLIGDDKFVIQGLPLATFESVNAPLGFDLAEAGTFTMSVIDLENIPENMNVTVLDKTTGLSHDLRAIESFTFTSEEVVNDRRFELQFSPNDILSVDGLSKDLKIFGTSSELTIQSSLEGEQQLLIYSLDGKVAFSESINFSSNTVTIKPSLTQNKVYVLRMGEQSFKFVIK